MTNGLNLHTEASLRGISKATLQRPGLSCFEMCSSRDIQKYRRQGTGTCVQLAVSRGAMRQHLNIYRQHCAHSSYTIGCVRVCSTAVAVALVVGHNRSMFSNNTASTLLSAAETGGVFNSKSRLARCHNTSHGCKYQYRYQNPAAGRFRLAVTVIPTTYSIRIARDGGEF